MQSLSTVGPRRNSVGPTLPPLYVNIYKNGRVVRVVEIPDPRAAYIAAFKENWADGEFSAGLPPVAEHDHSAAIAAIVADPKPHCTSHYRFAQSVDGRRFAMGPIFHGFKGDRRKMRAVRREFDKLNEADPIRGKLILCRKRGLHSDEATSLPVIMQLGVYDPTRPDKPPRLTGPKFFRTSFKVLQEIYRAVQLSQQRFEERGLPYCVGVFDASSRD